MDTRSSPSGAPKAFSLADVSNWSIWRRATRSPRHFQTATLLKLAGLSAMEPTRRMRTVRSASMPAASSRARSCGPAGRAVEQVQYENRDDPWDRGSELNANPRRRGDRMNRRELFVAFSSPWNRHFWHPNCKTRGNFTLSSHPSFTPHSITSSAATCKLCGTVRPSALAVLRLITSSNFVVRMTGRSRGFVPLRILAVYIAAWRYTSAKLIP